MVQVLQYQHPYECTFQSEHAPAILRQVRTSGVGDRTFLQGLRGSLISTLKRIVYQNINLFVKSSKVVEVPGGINVQLGILLTTLGGKNF